MTDVAAFVAERNRRLAARLARYDSAPSNAGLVREGVLKRVVGLTLEATGCQMPLGSPARLQTADGGWVDAEVVGFAGDRTYLMPASALHGLLPDARVVPKRGDGQVEVGEHLLGRVIDSNGQPLDGRGAFRTEGR